jgi:ABC-type multidrug transport system fused ATPase/permease subunit
MLSKKDKKRLFLLILAQTSLSLLDLLGVALIGLLASLTLGDINQNVFLENFSKILNFFGIDNASVRDLTGIIISLALIVFLSKTITSMIVTRKILSFLSFRGAEISAGLMAKFLLQPYLFVKSNKSQESLYAITRGVEILVMQVLASASILVSDLVLLSFVSLGLFFTDKGTAILTFLTFGLIGFALNLFMNNRASKLSFEIMNLNLYGNRRILEVIANFREALVRNNQMFYGEEIRRVRLQLASRMAETSFLPYVSKYVLETSIVISAIMIGGFQFLFGDEKSAIVNFTIFIVAGLRVTPSVLRIQQGTIQIRQGLTSGMPTLEFFDLFKHSSSAMRLTQSRDFIHANFDGSLKVENLSFTYPGDDKAVLKDITMEVEKGRFIAIVGPSGAGKTTLVDLFLGVLVPDSGIVRISDHSPGEAIEKWPNAIGYMAQGTTLIDGTIRENVSLGFSSDSAETQRVLKALEFAQLNDFVNTLEHGIDSQVGEGGSSLSGGQKQRIGIARALFTDPLLLVMDEATSALDSETEAAISTSLRKLKGKTTIIVIAHRLSTIRNADTIYYLKSGEIIAKGTFAEIKHQIPSFEAEIELISD